MLTRGGPTKQPFEIIDAKAQRWAHTWKHGAEQNDIIDALCAARAEAFWTELPRIPVSQIVSITRRMSDRTGRGFDNVGPADIRALSRSALSILRDLYLDIERRCQWPWQLMVNLVALKPKPTSGDRGIALVPWLIRLWTQLRDAPTRVWTSEHAGFWDQAVAGSSALKVALSRLVDDEIVQTLGTHTGCLYTDIKEFYDYLCPVKTLKAALDLGFPATIAVLSFSSYQGVRFLQGPDGCSLPLQSTRGIITGDKNSNNFARAALYNLLETAHLRYTMVQTREWVDDLVQRMFGPVARIQHHLGEAGLFVLNGLREAGFTISPKTTLVTTDRGLSAQLVQRFRTAGFPVHSALTAADLGIDRGFATRRRTPKHTKRWKNAWLRAKKIPRLARNLTSARTTRMLAVTGMLPSATYASKLLGMLPHNWIVCVQPR